MTPVDTAARSDASARRISRYVHLRRDGTGAASVSRFTLEAAGDARLQERFARETQQLAVARHAHLLRGVADPGGAARVSEALMVFAPSDSGWLSTLPLRRRVLMFAQLASAVGSLHRCGVVHGVLHPDRCGVRANGDLVLLDLGLVWSDDAGRGGGDDLTYAAPECRAGRGADARADVYSLGLLLYYFLTAAVPPRRGPIVLAEQFAPFQALLDTLLAPTPSQRPGSVTMLLDRLNATIMRSAALAEQLDSGRRIEETPVERAIASLSLQAQHAALPAPLAPAESGVSRWYARAGRTRRSTGARIGLAIAALVAAAAAIVYGLRAYSPAEAGLVESLARTAQTQLDAGRLLLPADDNALDTLRTLRSVDPDGPATSALAAKIRAALPAAVERTLDQQAFDAADAALSRALRAFPDDAALAALSDRMAASRRESAERAQRHELLQRLDALLAGARPGDDALTELLSLVQKAQALAPDDADVAARSRRVVTLLIERARAALSDDDLAAASAALGRLGDSFPDSTALTALDADYRRRAGVSRQQQLAPLLRDAAEAERGGLGHADALAGALDKYLAAIRLAPDDTAARDGALRLGRLAQTRAEEAVNAAEWETARRWSALARRAVPAAEIAALEQRIAQQRRDDAARRQELVAQAELALRRGRYFGPGDDGAAALYRKSGDAASPSRRQGLERVRAAALKDADALIAQRRYDDATALVDAALAEFGKDADFGRRKLTLTALKDRRSADAAPVATGTLSINAIPWAQVQSVTPTHDGGAVALDADATTPLRLTLPAGDYTVVLRDPADGGTRRVQAVIKAGSSTNISVNLRETAPAAAGAVRSEP